jgi:hypothetical protein
MASSSVSQGVGGEEVGAEHEGQGSGDLGRFRLGADLSLHQVARPETARRPIFDARLAYTLRHHGVTHFASSNEKHFGEFGFERVWNPLQSHL